LGKPAAYRCRCRRLWCERQLNSGFDLFGPFESRRPGRQSTPAFRGPAQDERAELGLELWLALQRSSSMYSYIFWFSNLHSSSPSSPNQTTRSQGPERPVLHFSKLCPYARHSDMPQCVRPKVRVKCHPQNAIALAWYSAVSGRIPVVPGVPCVCCVYLEESSSGPKNAAVQNCTHGSPRVYRSTREIPSYRSQN